MTKALNETIHKQKMKIKNLERDTDDAQRETRTTREEMNRLTETLEKEN